MAEEALIDPTSVLPSTSSETLLPCDPLHALELLVAFTCLSWQLGALNAMSAGQQKPLGWCSLLSGYCKHALWHVGDTFGWHLWLVTPLASLCPS